METNQNNTNKDTFIEELDAAIKEIQLIIPPFKEPVPEEAESDTVTSPKED